MALLFVTLWKYELASKSATFRLRALKRRLAERRGAGPRTRAGRRRPRSDAARFPLDEAGKYVAAAYLVFLALVLIYVAIMAGRLARIEKRPGRGHRRCSSGARPPRTTGRRSRGERAARRSAPRTRRRRWPCASGWRCSTGRSSRSCASWWRSEVDRGGRASRPATAPSSTSSAKPPSRPCSVLDARAGEPLGERCTSARNCDAARHLYRVVCGLDSMVVGEAEIQGQVKRAYERALAARTTGPLTNQLFRAALATGKRVRTETAVSVGHASVATVAVDAARALVGELASRHVVIVGAGENSEQVARAFHAHGVTTMFVANRRRDRAIALAARFGGASGSFDALPGRARARRRGRLLDRFAARDHRAGGAGRRDGGARRAAAAAASTWPCRATSIPPAPRSTA